MTNDYGIAEFEIDLYFVVSVVLLIPYFGWGLYTLIKRFHYHEELNPVLEIITLAGLALFYVVELALLRASLGPVNVYLILSVVGLFLAGLALYGHILLSLLSNLLVGVFLPIGRRQFHEPLYGAAEAREQQGDLEGAVSEYKVLARSFPKDAKTAIRLGDNLVRLGRPEEAAAWFEKGMENVDSPDESACLAFRIAEIYDRDLEQTDEATRVLSRYLEIHPNAEFSPSVRQRLERLTQRKEGTPA